MAETVTIGDQEVQITETEDGFEAEPVEDEPDSGVYLRAESNERDTYGFEVPIDSDFVVDSNSHISGTRHYVAWHTEDDISDMNSQGCRNAKRDGYDGYASVKTFEVVEY